MEAGKKWDLISLASIPLIMTLGNSMLIPILPGIRKTLTVTSLQVSLIITVYSLVAIPLIPIAGILSDRLGRKKVIVPSLIIAGLGGALSGYAAWKLNNAYLYILIGRVLQGVGAAGAAPIVMPLVGDMFHRQRDVSSGLGLIETSNTAGKVISPILGSLLASWIWFLPFWAIPVFCLISILMVLFLVRTPKDREAPPVSMGRFWKHLKAIFKQKGRWLYAIFFIGGICMFVVFATLFFLSGMLEEQYGVDGIRKGSILAIPLAALSLTSYFTGRAIGRNKKRMKWLTFLGMLFLTAAVSACGFFHPSLYVLIGLLCLSGIGIGLALPCLDAFLTEGIKKEQRGTITSIYSSIRFAGVAAGPPAASILSDRFSPALMFFAIAAMCLISAVLSLFAIKPGQAPSGKRRARTVTRGRRTGQVIFTSRTGSLRKEVLFIPRRPRRS
ncbi:MFS transporter [Paenibacillus aurantius]|uniref:MFS transporter n=1 Tax=Paenibacillus aurantius TaxID=2918900 RepID=A0AA96RGT8_9BACL|nr:MFS transporter [Paenibacillus aurantius]WNQ12836.1 MFS transporter [Paenibacillus aurantius]